MDEVTPPEGEDAVVLPIKPGMGTIKPVSRPTNHLKLRGLDCYDEVHQMIVEGMSPATVASLIQEDRGEYLDVTRGSLTAELNRYRKTLSATEKVADFLPKHVQTAATEIRKGLNEFDELADLFRLHRGRIDMGLEMEKKVGIPLPSMEREVRTAAEILVRSAELKIKLGIADAIIGSQQGDEEHAVNAAIHDRDVREVLENPERRYRLGKLAKKILHLTEDDKVDAVIDAELIESPETDS